MVVAAVRCGAWWLCTGGTEFDEKVVGPLGAGFRWNPPADHLRFSAALPDYAAAGEAAHAVDDASSDEGSAATVADLVRESHPPVDLACSPGLLFDTVYGFSPLSFYMHERSTWSTSSSNACVVTRTILMLRCATPTTS